AGNDTAQCAQTLTLVPNTAYTLSASVQGSYVFLGVSGGVSAQSWTSTTGYQPLSVNFTTGSATSVTVFVHGWYGQGTYFADDLAFVLDSGGCTPAWGGDVNHKVSGDSTVTGVVSAVRAKGGDVAVSFGGYNGTELGATCGGSSSLANAYQQVISRYNLTRID